MIKYENTFNYNFSDDNINISNSISQKNERPQIDTSLNSLITSSKIEYNNNFKIKNGLTREPSAHTFQKAPIKPIKKIHPRINKKMLKTSDLMQAQR